MGKNKIALTFNVHSDFHPLRCDVEAFMAGAAHTLSMADYDLEVASSERTVSDLETANQHLDSTCCSSSLNKQFTNSFAKMVLFLLLLVALSLIALLPQSSSKTTGTSAPAPAPAPAPMFVDPNISVPTTCICSGEKINGLGGQRCDSVFKGKH